MTYRPIIFSAPMVRALLDGRKAQTRRVLKPAQEGLRWPGPMWPHYVNGQRAGDISGDPQMTPLRAADGGVLWAGPTPIVPGDRLWVREACHLPRPGVAHLMYRADHPDAVDIRWRPSIHMPRWASRLTLHVTDVRVQRLQEIGDGDAVAEGATSRPGDWKDPDWSMDWSEIGTHSRVMGRALTQRDVCLGSARWAFASYWNTIHGPDAWEANPWVCAITFTVERADIDQARVA